MELLLHKGVLCFIFGKITFYMNFLAHTYLSPKDDQIMLGNLCGDFVKGKSMNGIHPKIAEGAKIHREIDMYTDSHREFREAKRIISPKFNHFSGVIIDMFFDYFLAKKWLFQAPLSLQKHISTVYQAGNLNLHILPERFQPVLLIMIKHDWLSSYSSHAGLEQILHQMTRRINQKSQLHESMSLLVENEVALEQIFNNFWKEISSEFDQYSDHQLIIE